jgi:hypothetical protein
MDSTLHVASCSVLAVRAFRPSNDTDHAPVLNAARDAARIVVLDADRAGDEAVRTGILHTYRAVANVARATVLADRATIVTAASNVNVDATRTAVLVEVHIALLTACCVVRAHDVTESARDSDCPDAH